MGNETSAKRLAREAALGHAPKSSKTAAASKSARRAGRAEAHVGAFDGDNAEQSEAEVPAPVNRSERLFSCPDEMHHSEQELVDQLLKVFFSVDGKEAIPSADARFSRFDGRKVPRIALREYVERITHYLSNVALSEKATRDPNCHSDLAMRYLVASAIYIERLCNKGLVVTPLNVHRLIITGCLIACKNLDDLQPGMSYFGDLGGLSVKELSEMEVAFVSLLDWKISIDPAAFRSKYAKVLGSSGGARDIFSSDLTLDYHSASGSTKSLDKKA